jgi:hypothetical protein
VNHRGIRRAQRASMMERMRDLWNNKWRLRRWSGEASAAWLGRMVSTHGKPCSCSMCCNFRKEAGPTPQERRATMDSIDVLRTEESMREVRREVEASECDMPACDCHTLKI